MNLFNHKTLKRHINPAPIPADHLAALDAWADMIRSGRVYALKETALHLGNSRQRSSKVFWSGTVWHAVVRSFPTNKLLEDAQLLVGWPVAAARDAGDHLDPADIVVGHEHVLKHRLEPLMVVLDCPVEMGGSSVWPSNDFPSKASLGQLHLYSYRKQIPSRSPMLNRHSFLTTCLLSRLNSISRTPPMGLDPECIAGVRARAPGLSTREVIWGADYDAVLIAAAPPLPTILVPCEGGPSHNPAEATVPKECSAEAQVLLEAVLDYHRRRAERREEVAA